MSARNWSHTYSITACPCYGAVGMHPTGMLSCFHIFNVKVEYNWMLSIGCHYLNFKNDHKILPILDRYTAREGNVFTGVCPQLVSHLLDHCLSLLRRSRYASYWNAFLFPHIYSPPTNLQESNVFRYVCL